LLAIAMRDGFAEATPRAYRAQGSTLGGAYCGPTLMRFAVVIPVARENELFARCVDACTRLTYEPRVICVVSDKPVTLPNDPHFLNLVTYAREVTGPATKRDVAWHHLPDADVYAYLDDDAYPPERWLDEAARVLSERPDAAGAGGPGLQPDDQTFSEQVSAAAMEMRAGSGPLRFRFWRDAPRTTFSCVSHGSTPSAVGRRIGTAAKIRRCAHGWLTMAA
jgi:hypothetical protein